jgi:hypothetical protein
MTKMTSDQTLPLICMHPTQVFIDLDLGGFLNLFLSKTWN